VPCPEGSREVASYRCLYESDHFEKSAGSLKCTTRIVLFGAESLDELTIGTEKSIEFKKKREKQSSTQGRVIIVSCKTTVYILLSI
jgi:hypothetical protein